ncbi:MAG: sigma-54-dependent Fis family transcriptional regulator [Ignavibacteriales bacterium]|nr:sigma-54-dependent Fis family transcriptional regulator [Ignavibacteriales bacterium]
MDRETFQREHGIIGRSLEIQEIVDVIRQVAPTDITVLITGESGVGKEVIARAIHGASKRSRKGLVTVNCGAIPEGLIESELFGHEKGSFTSAVETRKGYFEIADGGSILLDEIGEMPLATQVKLLRVLENGEFTRVGSSSPRTADLRVIAATNKDLQYEVQQKRFRPDLYFRLRSVNITIPPLRSRKGDVPLLVEHFVEEFTAKNGMKFEGFTDDATELIMSYHWPGNVRELKNVIESMLVLENGRRMNAALVRKYLREYQVPVPDRNLPVVMNRTVEQAERELIYRALVDLKGSILDLREILLRQSNAVPPDTETLQFDHANGNGSMSLSEMERRMIVNALERHKGNRRLAARDLNISERTLYRKIKEFGLHE